MRIRLPDAVLLSRLEARSQVMPNGCIEFMAYRDKQGYTRLWDGQEKRLAHRLAYELFIGPIPEGYEVDHLCFNRACINPAHLEAVTPKVNTLRSNSVSAINARATHCVNGHEFTPENTRMVRGATARACKACDCERARAYRQRDPERIAEIRRVWVDENRARINAERRRRYAERIAA